MSTRNWTADQQDAINARAGTLIVSAAAGSGKTAVLIERIIKRLTDTQNPCDADKLLIVTFTRAATAEMRARLSAALTKALKDDPANDNLRRQQMLLPSANIYTIDAFCGNIVKENFESLGIAPDYDMLDESESKILQKQAVSTVIESLYEEGTEEFKSLVELLFCGRDDSSLEDNILKLYTYSRAYASPTDWLQKAAEIYKSTKNLTDDNPIGKSLKENTKEYVSYVKETISSSLNRLEENEELIESTSASILKGELAFCEKELELLNKCEFDEAINLTDGLSFPRWSNPKGLKDHPDIIQAKLAHGLAKEAFEKNGEGLRKFICETQDDFHADLKFLSPIASKLIEATIMFDKEFMNLKTLKNSYDFSDIEHFALKLLVENPSDESLIRTQLANDISESFEEILIDEYQDTNKAQDMIFRAISKNESNLFMVGDVKQSIYGFRQAMPDIFLEKKNSYRKYDNSKDEYPAYVTLGKNFRSRKGVTECINFIFSQIMSNTCGNVTYDKNEQLVYGATYEEASEPETEFNILKISKDDNGLEKEAEFIAKYITDKVENNEDNYGDFVILMQTQSKRAPVFEKILKEYGIPVYTEAATGFLSTPDIQTIVSLLKIIDNPLNDIPLMSVMLSEIFGFTPKDIAKLRIDKRSDSLFSAVLVGEKSADPKCIRLCKTLRLYRRLSVTLPAGELVRQIYADTLYPEIVSSLPNGIQRKANLRLFQQYADKFDGTNSFGISSFVRYLDRLLENNVDQASSSTVSESANIVRIMSIHKSKGLEFKYCILADTTKSFNKMDLNQNLILHPRFGLGIKGRDLATGNTYPSLIHSVVKVEANKTLMSETLRVLYVALTRAKEKLIILSSTSTEPEKLADKAIGCLNGTNNINPYVVRSAGSFFDWLLPALIRHPACKELRDFSVLPCSVIPSDFNLSFSLIDISENASQQEELKVVNTDENIIISNEAKLEINKVKEETTSKIDFVYHYLPLANIATKRAASSANKKEFSTEFFASAIPEFIGNNGLTPAQRGTCLHKFMQYVNFNSAANDFDLECNRLTSMGFMTGKEIKAVDKNKVENFINSGIGKRMLSSCNIMREKKFAILVPASTFDGNLTGELANEPVLIQGIADCVFEENNELIILDYKTDNTKDENVLIERHKDQLTTYVHALSKCIGKPVTAAYIYAFSLDKEIKVI